MKPWWNRGLDPHDDLKTVEMKAVCAWLAAVIILAVVVGQWM